MIKTYRQKSGSIFPLVTFRILFGGLMAFGAIRIMANGWVEKLYFEPVFFFKYFGFEWVPYPGDAWMYPIFALMALAAIGMASGFLYRFSCALFFILFCWTELIDATNYLNHHYLVAILSFFMILLPANRFFSLDVRWKITQPIISIPKWQVDIIKVQIVLVYTFAGLAKINTDWLIHAMPLAIWLPEHKDLPVIGQLFTISWIPWVMSWLGALYDLTIGWLLLLAPNKILWYIFVIVFHVFTYLLFNIGLFPFIMIFSNVIFFNENWHKKIYERISGFSISHRQPKAPQWAFSLLVVVLVFQVLVPLRHYLYHGDVLWTEEGYRFSWRVMLVEKSGHAQFKVMDQESNRYSYIQNGHYLTPFQEKQMSIQPDFILQYAEHLGQEYQRLYHIQKPKVTADVQVALNTRSAKSLFDSEVNLLELKNSIYPKNWLNR